MNKERLLKLADFLEKLPPDHWNYSYWASRDNDFISKVPNLRLNCGTQACALGWACAIPEFKEAGLRIVITKGFVPVAMVVDNETSPEEYKSQLSSVKAGARFFGLTNNQALDIFIGARPSDEDNEQATAKDVANDIRELVASDEG